jgi:hypothetical protein
MKPTETELDEHVKGLLDRLRKVSPLGPQAVAEERAKFLAQGEKFRAAVSQPKSRRHNGWINTFVLAFPRKERIPMLNTLMAIVISLTLLFGGAGATVYAAQSSLPDETLYPVKTWSEDVRLSLAGSSQGQLDLTLDFTNRRITEIAGLQADGKPVPGGAATRLQNELDVALQIAAGMEDSQMVQALVQIRLRAETQSQTMTTLMGSGSGQDNPELARLQERLQEQVRLAAAGEADLQGFRLQVRDRDRQNSPSQTPNSTQPGTIPHTPSATPVPTGNSYGPGSDGGQATGTPGHYGPGGPNPSQTPMPTGGSYGPGPGAGQQTSTPGGYGPGPQASTSTCTPAQNGGGPGNGTNPSQTPQSSGPGSGSQNPTVTMQPSGPGSGTGQSTATPQQSGNPGGGQTVEPPGLGGGRP